MVCCKEDIKSENFRVLRLLTDKFVKTWNAAANEAINIIYMVIIKEAAYDNTIRYKKLP